MGSRPRRARRGPRRPGRSRAGRGRGGRTGPSAAASRAGSGGSAGPGRGEASASCPSRRAPSIPPSFLPTAHRRDRGARARPVAPVRPTVHVDRATTRSDGMDLHEALYTTRAMRRVTDEPIPLDAQARILDAAIRAPSGGNQQGWRFLLVDDAAPIAAARRPVPRLDGAAVVDGVPRAHRGRGEGPARRGVPAVRAGPRLGAVARRQLRDRAAVPVLVLAIRPVGRVDLPRGVERDARGACRGDRLVPHRGAVGLPPRRGARAARRPRRRGMERCRRASRSAIRRGAGPSRRGDPPTRSPTATAGARPAGFVADSPALAIYQP